MNVEATYKRWRDPEWVDAYDVTRSAVSHLAKSFSGLHNDSFVYETIGGVKKTATPVAGERAASVLATRFTRRVAWERRVGGHSILQSASFRGLCKRAREDGPKARREISKFLNSEGNTLAKFAARTLEELNKILDFTEYAEAEIETLAKESMNENVMNAFATEMFVKFAESRTKSQEEEEPEEAHQSEFSEIVEDEIKNLGVEIGYDYLECAPVKLLGKRGSSIGFFIPASRIGAHDYDGGTVAFIREKEVDESGRTVLAVDAGKPSTMSPWVLGDKSRTTLKMRTVSPESMALVSKESIESFFKRVEKERCFNLIKMQTTENPNYTPPPPGKSLGLNGPINYTNPDIEHEAENSLSMEMAEIWKMLVKDVSGLDFSVKLKGILDHQSSKRAPVASRDVEEEPAVEQSVPEDEVKDQERPDLDTIIVQPEAPEVFRQPEEDAYLTVSGSYGSGGSFCGDDLWSVVDSLGHDISLEEMTIVEDAPDETLGTDKPMKPKKTKRVKKLKVIGEVPELKEDVVSLGCLGVVVENDTYFRIVGEMAFGKVSVGLLDSLIWDNMVSLIMDDQIKVSEAIQTLIKSNLLSLDRVSVFLGRLEGYRIKEPKLEPVVKKKRWFGLGKRG